MKASLENKIECKETTIAKLKDKNKDSKAELTKANAMLGKPPPSKKTDKKTPTKDKDKKPPKPSPKESSKKDKDETMSKTGAKKASTKGSISRIGESTNLKLG